MPAGHVYVRHLRDPDRDDGVERLPDVEPGDGARVPGGWWPPLMLDADWIRDNRHAFDVFPTRSPPVGHLDDILRNAALFHSRWGWWPMAGWLAEFARAGLVRYDRRHDRWERQTAPSGESLLGLDIFLYGYI